MSKQTPKTPLSELLQSGGLLPQESLLEIPQSNKELFIGIPKEVTFQENRIPLIPEAVKVLVNNGHRIIIETEAGNNANFADADYSEAGASIAYTKEDVYKADLILKVAPPTLKELDLMQYKQTLISILQISMQPTDFMKKLSEKKITAFAYEFIRDKSDVLPIIQTLSEIVGSSSVLIAAEYLSNAFSGKGELLGGITGIPPTEVVILGAGTVGENAAKTAIGLGAHVKVFDFSLHKLRRLQKNLGISVYTSLIAPSILSRALKTADVAIGAILSKEGRTPIVVTDDMVSEMKSGSVIIDVSIDQGGCFETSEVTNHLQPIFRKYGVIHYCVPNIASRVARTASHALSNIFAPILLNLGNEGGINEMLWADRDVRKGVYCFNGTVTNKYVSDVCKLPYRDLNLLMASRL